MARPTRALQDSATAAELGFEPPARTSVAADAVDQIKQMILDGRLTPGQRLPSERVLSEALGLSRPTVREAIGAMVALNILESRQGSGTYVASLEIRDLLEPLRFALALSPSGLQQLFEVRAMLEPKAAGLAARNASAEQIGALTACVRASSPHRSFDRFVELDVELHTLVAVASGNEILIHVLASLSELGVESRRKTVRKPGVVKQSTADHERIAAAISDRDAAKAELAMLEHLHNVQRAATPGRER